MAFNGTTPERPAGKIQHIRIVIRHHNDPEGKFTPQHTMCADDAAKGRTGCGKAIVFYRTYPNDKRMPFDSEPHVIDSTQMENGMVIATVTTENVHFSTCAARKQPEERPTAGFRDARMRAAGGDR